MNTGILEISLVSLDFEQRTRDSDDELVRHILFVLRSSKKRILPRNLVCDTGRVSRASNRLTVHLYSGEIEKARVSLVPSPGFGGGFLR